MTPTPKIGLEKLGMVMRPGRESDYGLVYDSWINSLHTGNPVYKSVRMKAFKTAYRSIIEKNLSSPLKLVVVCDQHNKDLVYGWAMHDFFGKLLYVYVTQLWRSKGLGTELVKAVPSLNSYACWTFAFRDWARRMDLEFLPMEFDPVTYPKK